MLGKRKPEENKLAEIELTKIVEESVQKSDSEEVFERKEYVLEFNKNMKNSLALYSDFRARDQFIQLDGKQDIDTMRSVMEDKNMGDQEA